MSEKDFPTNLLKFVAAELYASLGLQAAREMFDKSYFALGLAEKQAVDQAVLNLTSSNYRALTPEFLNPSSPKEPVGFQSPRSEPKINPEKT